MYSADVVLSHLDLSVRSHCTVLLKSSVSLGFLSGCLTIGIVPVAQTVKNLSAMQETQVRSLGWQDPLEKVMAIHSNILAWRIPWTEVPGGLRSIALQRVRHD